jgi:hypothetical protein
VFVFARRALRRPLLVAWGSSASQRGGRTRVAVATRSKFRLRPRSRVG